MAKRKKAAQQDDAGAGDLSYPAADARSVAAFFDDEMPGIGDLNNGFSWELGASHERFAEPFFRLGQEGAYTLKDSDHIVVVSPSGHVERIVHKARAEECGVADATILDE